MACIYAEVATSLVSHDSVVLGIEFQEINRLISPKGSWRYECDVQRPSTAEIYGRSSNYLALNHLVSYDYNCRSILDCQVATAAWWKK